MGHEHKHAGIANQDAYLLGGVTVGTKKYVIGMVSDGCTEKRNGKKSHSEVGANLMCEFVTSEIGMLLSAGVDMEQVPSMLFPRCIGYLRNLVGSTKSGPPEVITDLVSRMFLCTTVAFIKDEERLVLFHDADGVYIVNDDVVIIDQKNKPTYLGLHLFDERTVQKYGIVRPTGYTVRKFEVAQLKRFAIATDGISEKKDGKLIVRPEDVGAIWSNSPNAPAGLQWMLNKLSNFEHRLGDDATVIAAALKTTQ